MIRRTAISRALVYALIGSTVYLSVDSEASARPRTGAARRRALLRARARAAETKIGGVVDRAISSRDLDSRALSDLSLFRIQLAVLRADPKLRGQDDVLAASGFSLVQLCGEWIDVGALKTGEGIPRAAFLVVQQQLEREVIAELTRYSRLESELQIQADDVPLPRIDEDATEDNHMANLDRVLKCVLDTLHDNPDSKESAGLRSILNSDAGLAEELRAAVKEWPENVGNDEALGEVTSDVSEQELRKTLSETLVKLDEKLIQIRLQASRLSSEVRGGEADKLGRPPTQTEQLFGPATEEPVSDNVAGEAAESEPPREPLSKEELAAEMLKLRRSLLTASLLARSAGKAGEAEWAYAPVEEEEPEPRRTPVKSEPRKSMLPLVILAFLAAVVVRLFMWSMSQRENKSV